MANTWMGEVQSFFFSSRMQVPHIRMEAPERYAVKTNAVVPKGSGAKANGSVANEGSLSGQNLSAHIAVNIGEPKIPARIAIGKCFVIEAEQMQHGGVQVVDVDLVLHGLEPELVGGAVNRSALHPAAR